MLRIRLHRAGAKKRPAYRVVVAEATAPRDGRALEVLGQYNPLADPATVRMNEERLRYWLQVGAKPTDRVARLLSNRPDASMGT